MLVPRLSRWIAVFAVWGAALAVSPWAEAAQRRDLREDWGLLGPQPELDELSWLTSGVRDKRPFRLVPDASLPLLAHYVAPWQNHVAEWRSFFRGDYGLSSWNSRLALSWRLEGEVPEPAILSVSTRGPCPRWRAPRSVHVARYDGLEQARLPLTDCEGGIAPDAVDVISVLARGAGVPKPELPLPIEPTPDAGPGEWLPNIKLLDPRLIWAMQKVAEAFPHRTLYIMSGYRQGGHSGFHGKGKAVDLFVHGIANERLFAVCRTLRDVGCGYYPNGRFVHIDVRPYGTDRVLWVDDSSPGTPSHYLDGYPGVLEPGVAWVPQR